MAKNLMLKERKQDDPYMVFEGGPFGPTKVLKVWQADHTKPFGRWFVAVNGDLGDSYVTDILRYQRLTYLDPKVFDGDVVAAQAFVDGLNAARPNLPNNEW